MIYKFPLRIPYGRVVSITQGFKSNELAEWYKAHGIIYPEHLAVDAICGNSVQTYGAAFVCPFPGARIVPGNAVQADPERGISGRILIEHVNVDGNIIIIGGI